MVKGVTLLSVKQVGLAFPYPTKKAPENWTASCVITKRLVAALRDQEEFWTVRHATTPLEGQGGGGGGTEEELVAVVGSTEEDPSRCPRLSHMPLTACDKDRRMAESTVVHSKRHITRCAGMARCPLPSIRNISPRPTQTM